jgi:magnesium-transporting ATPase (P-type)
MVMKLYQLMSRLPVLTSLFNIIFYSLAGTSHIYDDKMTFYVVALILIFLQVMLFHFVYFKEVLNMERKWNKMEILRLTLVRNSIQSKSIKISDLKVGDVVYLKGDTISPADIMVIDTSNQRHADKIFHVSERRITGDNKIMTKNAIKNMNPQKSDKAPRSISNIGGKQFIPDMADKLLKKFSGYLEYDAPNSFVDFVGSLRLKNDPRVSKVSKDNILFCGTKLYTTWIIGMVIYNGFYTKIMQRNYNQTLFSKDLLKFKKSVIYCMIDKIALVSVFSSLAITFIILIMMLVNSDEFKRLQVINSRSSNQEFFSQLGFQLTFAFDVVPLSLYIMYDLACFLKCAEVENLWAKLFNSIKATVKAYYTAIQIKCKKKGPRAGRRDNSHFSKALASDRNEKLKTQVMRGASRKGTQQSADNIQLEINGIGNESGRNSPGSSQKNLGDVTIRNAAKKTTIGYGAKIGIGQGSDIVVPGSNDLIKVIDYGVLSDLGSVDHVVFDKTDTLTTSHLEIVKFATVNRCYNIECGLVADKMTEITTPGNNLALNDSQDEEVKERGSYSEKSQEYLDELEGDYRPEINDEDSTWTAMIRGLEQPSYNLDVGGGNGSNAQLTVIGQSIDESPAVKNHMSSVTAFFNERGRNSRRTGQPGEDFLNISSHNNASKKRNTLLRGVLEERGHTKSIIGLPGDNQSSRMLGNEFSDKASEAASSQSDSFRLMLKPSKVMPLDKFIRDIYFKKEEVEQFLAMTTLFNRFTLEGERNSKAQAMEDKAISDLLKNIGYQLSSSKKNKESTVDAEFRIKCSTTNHTVDYRVVGVNFFSHQRERASIVFNDTSTNTGEAFILVKGAERSMFGIMTMNDKEKNILRELSSNFKSQGLKMVMYGIKKLSYEEVLSFRGSYMEIMKSPRDQKEGFELLAIDVEKNLRFIGCFGIRDNVCPEGLAFSHIMRDIGIKFSILSGDNKDNCLNIARTLELTKSVTEESGIKFSISSTEEDEIESAMKRIMDQIYEDMKKLNQDEMKRADRDIPVNTTEIQMVLDNIKQRLFKASGDTENDWQDEEKDFLSFEFDPLSFRNLAKRTLLLNGESVNKIVSTPFLLTQLRCILLFCNSVVGYSMQPSHKATIVKLLRSNNNVVLAVGDGFNDIRMVREANIGVQLANADVPVVFSDIVVGSIGALRKAMFTHAAGFSKNLLVAKLTLFWIILTQLFVYSVLYVNSTHLSELFRLDTKILRIIFIIILCFITLFDQPYRAQALDVFPILYRENVIARRHFRVLFLTIIILSLGEISLIYSVYVFFSSVNNTPEGYPKGILFFENFVTIVSTVNACMKVYLMRTDKSPVFTILLAVVAIAIFPIVLAENNLSSQLDRTEFSRFFSDYSVLASLIWSILLPCIMNWVMVTTLQVNYISYLVNHLSVMNKLIEKHPDKGTSKKLGTTEKMTFLNESLKELQNKRYIGTFQVTNLVNIVRRITLEQPMSISVGRIISIDLFNYQVGLKKFSNYINERVDRSKFREYLMHIMKKNTRIQLILYMLVYLAAMIVGLSTKVFRDNYMLDSLIPYMILMIGFILWINSSIVYHSKLYKFFIIVGSVSFILTLIFSSISHNRFELNFIDLYNGRIWFSVCLEMIDASILVVLHLVGRILA